MLLRNARRRRAENPVRVVQHALQWQLGRSVRWFLHYGRLQFDRRLDYHAVQFNRHQLELLPGFRRAQGSLVPIGFHVERFVRQLVFRKRADVRWRGQQRLQVWYHCASLSCGACLVQRRLFGRLDSDVRGFVVLCFSHQSRIDLGSFDDRLRFKDQLVWLRWMLARRDDQIAGKLYL